MPHPEEGTLVSIRAGDAELHGNLAVPANARGIVLFAHGSGSSRHSPRNQFVAAALRASALATLLIDLLTPEEEQADLGGATHRFDIGLLADRLGAATDWLGLNPGTRRLKIGYFGASTGAGAALRAAAGRDAVGAIVSRGGRPDLAGEALARVKAPTLLIVGGDDLPVIRLNKEAYDQLRAEKRLEIIARASHLFEEPGALERVADLARDWFLQHLAGRTMRAQG